MVNIIYEAVDLLLQWLEYHYYYCDIDLTLTSTKHHLHEPIDFIYFLFRHDIY